MHLPEQEQCFVAFKIGALHVLQCIVAVIVQWQNTLVHLLGKVTG